MHSMFSENGSTMISVLFVCLGNICRSPLAQGVFMSEAVSRGLSHCFTFDSAGTGGWHAGDPPDPRSIATCAANGVDISALRARKLLSIDYERFDHIFAMDRNNLSDIRQMGSGRAETALFMEACLGKNKDVPDPYYGTKSDFDQVYRMVRTAADSWFETMAARVSG